MAKYKCLVSNYTSWKKGHVYDETEMGISHSIKWAVTTFPDEWELHNDDIAILADAIMQLREEIVELKNKLNHLNLH
jgi:hypothetical protein